MVRLHAIVLMRGRGVVQKIFNQRAAAARPAMRALKT
jgi:hypothetical protein